MRYSIPAEVKPEFVAGRPTLSTPQNGRVALDKTMLSLWQAAGDHTLGEVVASFRARLASPPAVAAGLACLAEAGLLQRADHPSPDQPARQEPGPIPSGPSISAVIVAFNGLKWMPNCLDSLKAQSMLCKEIILVDNASGDGTAEWVAANYPEVCLLKMEQAVPFAKALNAGLAKAGGDFYLALNQDVRLDPGAVAALAAAVDAPQTAAVAASLHFTWAEAFLNGIGNQVRRVGWGMDNFIGHLDLGQFDSKVSDVPSMCLAAALISRKAWEQVGPLDERFPMYYEDSEWSYRARLMGWSVRAAPQAIVFHAFGGQGPANDTGANAVKLKNVVYGRLHFTARLLSGWSRTGRLISAGAQDLLGLLAAVVRLNFHTAAAYWQGWSLWLKQPDPPLRFEPNTQAAVFTAISDIPCPRVWRGMPELTWDLVCSDYLPTMLSGQTRPIPELSELTAGDLKPVRVSISTRLALLYEGEGLRAVLRYFWRTLRWKLG